MRYLFCKKSIFPRIRERDKTLLVGKSRRKHTRFAIPAVRDFHGNRNPPGSENPQRVVADGEDFGVYAPVRPTAPCFSFLSPSLPLLQSINAWTGFTFAVLKCCTTVNWRVGTVEKTGSRIRSMTHFPYWQLFYNREKFFVTEIYIKHRILIRWFNNL